MGKPSGVPGLQRLAEGKEIVIPDTPSWKNITTGRIFFSVRPEVASSRYTKFFIPIISLSSYFFFLV